jgi:hypothetical protein
VSKPKRFRDMSLTEDEAAALVFEHWQDGTDLGVDRLVRIQVRARGLFPLWREWGLRELYEAGQQSGRDLFLKAFNR